MVDAFQYCALTCETQNPRMGDKTSNPPGIGRQHLRGDKVGLELEIGVLLEVIEPQHFYTV